MGKTDLITRRNFMLGSASAAATFAAAPSFAASSHDAQAIVDRFTSAPTMTGRFVQFSPKGEMTEGTFSIRRPGNVRFDYDEPSALQVIADGRSVAVGNRKLRTWDLYPLSKTPLKLLLDTRIDLRDRRVTKVSGQDNLVAVTLADPKLFDKAYVQVMFDERTYELRQWTVVDSARKETSVVVHDVRTGIDLPASTFRIPYGEIRTLK